MEPVQEEVRDPWGYPRPVQAEQGRVQAWKAQHLQVIYLSLSLSLELSLSQSHTNTVSLQLSLYIYYPSISLSTDSPKVTGDFRLFFFISLYLFLNLFF